MALLPKLPDDVKDDKQLMDFLRGITQVLDDNEADKLGGWLPTLPMCYVRMNADQSISANVWTKMQFSNKILDPYNNFNTNTFNFVAPSPGYYFVTACFAVWTPSAPPYTRRITIAKNDGLITHLAANDGEFARTAGATCNAILYLNTNEYVSAYLYVSADTTIRVDFCGFTVMRIR